MELDITTLATLVSFIAVVAGVILLATGWQHRDTAAPVVWGFAHGSAAIGLMLLAVATDIDLAGFCILASAALVWGAVAAFHRHRVPVSPLVLGLAVVAATALGPFEPPAGLRTAIYQVPMLAYLVFASLELWKGRTERLAARWPLLALIVVESTVVAAGIVAGFVDPLLGPIDHGGYSWMVLLTTLVFIVGTTVSVVAMINERSVNEQAAVARYDALTGILNRGAFIADAKTGAAAAAAAWQPTALAMFDLDHFKRVNDTFGHHVGDLVLQRFALVARQAIRQGDILGRIGGEEFALFLQGSGSDTAAAIADRVRIAFAADTVSIDGNAVNATVSAGVASGGGSPPTDLDDLLGLADRALYEAKASGRNCVHIGGDARDAADHVALRMA